MSTERTLRKKWAAESEVAFAWGGDAVAAEVKA